jgi:hypothetical protein
MLKRKLLFDDLFSDFCLHSRFQSSSVTRNEIVKSFKDGLGTQLAEKCFWGTRIIAALVRQHSHSCKIYYFPCLLCKLLVTNGLTDQFSDIILVGKN